MIQYGNMTMSYRSGNILVSFTVNNTSGFV